MNTTIALRSTTAEYFDAVNFTALSDNWVDEVILNEFTDAQPNTVPYSVLFESDPAAVLSRLADVCVDWCDKAAADETTDSASEEACPDEEGFWKVLEDLKVQVTQIQAVVYLLCDRATFKDASVKDKTIGLVGAKFYFNLLRIPGSGAYSVYHPTLFQSCIKCMPSPDLAAQNSDVEEMEDISLVYASALLSLVPVLKNVHLGSDSSVVESVVRKLADLAACETHTRVEFDANLLGLREKELLRRFQNTLLLSTLAYQCFSAILSTELNGDRDANYLLILSYLNKHIACYNARKGSTINQKYLTIKDNAVRFVCHNMANFDFAIEPTKVALKRLSLNVIDKVEFRAVASSAIISILQSMPPDSLAETVKWYLLLVDSAETRDRAFALDVLGQLLTHVDEAKEVPEILAEDWLRASVVFAVLTRCDDASPNVRTRALTALSQNMSCILKFLEETRERENFEIGEDEEYDEEDVEVNGNRRFFWYNLGSFRERLNEIAAILQRRVEDSNATARRAALVALENLLVFDPVYINEENLKYFACATKDSYVAVRKQLIQCLSVILGGNRDNVNVQESWIKCILPLIDDPETSVQAKALSVVEEMFLQKIYSPNQADKELAFSLLKILSSVDFSPHQQRLQKAFRMWKTEKRLRPQAVVHLENYIGTEWEEYVWFYLASFSVYCTLPLRTVNLCLQQFQRLDSCHEYPPLMETLLKILLHSHQQLSLENSEVVRNRLCGSLSSFSVPLNLIPTYIELLYKIYKYRNTDSEFAEFSSTVIQKCEDHLIEIKTAASFPEPPSEELMAKYFCSITEFCQLCVSNITPNVISLLKTFAGCITPSRTLSKILSPGLRAHAFAALGKICLQDEVLANELLEVFATELLSSKHDVIRSNAAIILIEMCKRYTSSADKYVRLISTCFKDKLYLIRYQTIVLIINLLQEGYIKFRGYLFFCLLSTLVDKKQAIQELGRYSLSQLLHDKKQSLFAEHFIDSIYVFNSFAPPDNEAVSKNVEDLKQFSMPGDRRREERMLLFQFLLESMAIRDRAFLIKSLCDIITAIAESVYPQNKTTECILRDIFAILTCPEIRTLNVSTLEDCEDEVSLRDYKKTELQTRKVIIIDPVVPCIVALKNSITDSESNIVLDIILFLKELLHDFKDCISEILAMDKALRIQLEYEWKNDAERERVERRTEKNMREKNKQVSNEEQDEESPMTLQELDSRVKNVSQRIAPQDKKVAAEDGKDATDGGQQTPQNKHMRQAQRSARRAISSLNISENISGVSRRQIESTPRVVLTPVKVPLASDIMNISAIENVQEPMIVDESDGDN